jgi:hypothetical protein
MEKKMETLGIAPDEPYPTGHPWQSREDLLKSIHSPMELVEAKDWDDQNTRNLAAGGSVEMKDVLISDAISGKPAAGARSRESRAQADQEDEARRGLR